MSQFLVLRLYIEGARVQKHLRLAGKSRGTLVIELEKVGRRQALVARLHAAPDFPKIPPLHDVVLLGTSASSLVLTGHERVEATMLDQKERVHGQTWLVQPTHEADVMAIESKWTAAARRCAELELQLRALLDERLFRSTLTGVRRPRSMPKPGQVQRRADGHDPPAWPRVLRAHANARGLLHSSCSAR